MYFLLGAINIVYYTLLNRYHGAWGDTLVISHHHNNNEEIDPDPFVLGLGILTLVFTAGMYLEARRSNKALTGSVDILTSYQNNPQSLSTRERGIYRSRWYESQRALSRGRELVEGYQELIQHYRLEHEAFRFGSSRLRVSRADVRDLQRMATQIGRATSSLATHIDRLSEFLDDEDFQYVESIRDVLEENQQPHSFDAVVLLALRSLDLFDELLGEIGRREGFGESAPPDDEC